MKKCVHLTLLCVAFIALVSASAQGGVGFRLKGGFSYIRYSDYNDFADHITDVVLPEQGIAGELGNIHWVPEFSGEVMVSLVPSFSVGVGAGMIYGKSDFSFGVVGSEFTYEHTVKAYPITVTGYFNPPLPLGVMKPYVFGGAGMYYSRITFEQMVTGGGQSVVFDAELTKWGFGLHGGVGFEFSIAPVVSIDVGFSGRWVRIEGYEGTATMTNGETVDMDIFLVGGEDEDGDPIFGPESVDEKDQWEEGSVDLSGFGFTIGVKLMF